MGASIEGLRCELFGLRIFAMFDSDCLDLASKFREGGRQTKVSPFLRIESTLVRSRACTGKVRVPEIVRDCCEAAQQSRATTDGTFWAFM